MDVIEFLAQRGGLRDDEGHGLGLVRQDGAFAGQKGGRDWQRMTRRNGRLLRRNGKSIDEAGEMLWEAGYLRGRDSERPTTTEVLAYLDQRMLDGKPRLPIGEEPAGPALAPEKPYWHDMPHERGDPLADISGPMAEGMSFAATWIGTPLEKIDPDILWRARDIWHDLPGSGDAAGDWDEAVMRAVNDFADANRWDAVEQTGGTRYEDVDYDWPDPSSTGREAGAAAGDSGGPAGSAADAGAGGARGGAAAGSAEKAVPLADVPEAERTRFLDPDGPEATAQAEVLEHDARLALDPNLIARQAQETQLRAEAPLRGENATGQAQDGTMGLGLFDAADQPQFRLDIEGEERGLKDLLDEIDADARDIDTIESCMKPIKPEGPTE
jgi:hypothetical protein